jgi:hypothetical protein
MVDSKTVALPAHLWEALDAMSHEMGVGRDALVAQSVYTLARLNGFLVPGRVEGRAAPASSPSSVQASPAVGPAAKAPQAAKPGPAAPAAAKVLPGARAKPVPVPEPEPEPEAESEPRLEAGEDEAGNPFDQPSVDVEQDEPVQEAAQVSNVDEEPLPEDEPAPEEEHETNAVPPPATAAKSTLTLMLAGREPHKMTGDVLTLGRGKTCEYVIDSNRVSREHARVIREGSDFWLEDLNSSNGTFFGPAKEKVTRRKIKDNDEFTFGTEKVRFLLRK